MCAIIVAPQLYGEKSKMSARRHFWGGWYPPVFADVGEGKELWAGRVYAGEALDLRRKWKFENGKLEERGNAFNAEDAENAENAEEEGEEGKAERGDMEDEQVRIWEGIW